MATPRYLLRPCRLSDLPSVERIAEASVVGITSLPPDRDKLARKIRNSMQSFSAEVDSNGEEQYFFVLENAATGEIVGTSGLVASAGFHDRFYSYRNEIIVHASQELGVSNRIHALNLCHDLTGYSLLTSFYIDPALATSRWPQLLSRARLLFVAEHRERFADKLAAEHPGVCDDSGRSPFWDAVGRRFFNMDYPQAERLAGGRSKTFIAELMPQYPIYVPLLPADAKLAIGQLHPVAELPFSILLEEGFEADTYIDIFDGGPTVETRISGIRSIVGSRRVTIVHAMRQDEPPQPWLISNTRTEEFRATIAELPPPERDQVAIPRELAQLLEVTVGDELRMTAL